MRVALRASAVTLSALLLTAVIVAVAAVPSLFTVVALAGTTVLIMGGTGHPLSAAADTVAYVKQYMGMAVDNYVSPSPTGTGIPDGPYNSVAVVTPEEDAPDYGTLTLRESVTQGLAALDNCISSSVCDYNRDVGSAAPSASDSFVVFGYSQSAAIAMLEKARLAAEYAPGQGPDVSFVTIGSARPNGGLVARDTTGLLTTLLFGLGRDELITDPVPTDTQYSTVDIALQYDGFSDFPLNPLNLLASLNAYMGIMSLHGTYGEHSLSDPGVLDQGLYGDTHYYSIPAEVLPLLKPLESIPLIGRAWADSWDPVLRVVIESAYDRSVSPGEESPFNVFYSEGLLRLATNVFAAIPIGMDNGVESLFGVRPLGTIRPGAYGVGGADIDSATTESEAVVSATPRTEPWTDSSADPAEGPASDLEPAPQEESSIITESESDSPTSDSDATDVDDVGDVDAETLDTDNDSTSTESDTSSSMNAADPESDSDSSGQGRKKTANSEPGTTDDGE